MDPTHSQRSRRSIPPGGHIAPGPCRSPTGYRSPHWSALRCSASPTRSSNSRMSCSGPDGLKVPVDPYGRRDPAAGRWRLLIDNLQHGEQRNVLMEPSFVDNVLDPLSPVERPSTTAPRRAVDSACVPVLNRGRNRTLASAVPSLDRRPRRRAPPLDATHARPSPRARPTRRRRCPDSLASGRDGALRRAADQAVRPFSALAIQVLRRRGRRLRHVPGHPRRHGSVPQLERSGIRPWPPFIIAPHERSSKKNQQQHDQ